MAFVILSVIDEKPKKLPLLAKNKKSNVICFFIAPETGFVVFDEKFNSCDFGERITVKEGITNSENWEILPKGTSVKIIQE